MTIKYPNGQTSEALILSRTNHKMRVVLKGSDDSTELAYVNGAWFLEGLEPVELEFVWQSQAQPITPAVSECVCSASLAAKLVELLYARSRDGQITLQKKHLTAGSPLVS